MRKENFLKFAIIFFVLSFILTGCSLIPKVSDLPKIKDYDSKKPQTIEEKLAIQSEIKKFENYDELKDFLEENGSGDSYGYYFDDILSRSKGELALEEVGAPSAIQKLDATTATGFGGGTDYSTTNIQVEGVDEADIVKTDGRYVYAVVKKDLYIIEAFPPEDTKILSKIEFKSRPQDIYINEDRLIIYGQDEVFYETEVYKSFRRRTSYTFFKVFDISDRKNPKQVRDMDFEGNYNNSRMIGDYVYFVTSYYGYYYIENEPVLPRIIENGEVLIVGCEEQTLCIEPDVYYFPMPYPGYNFTSVTAINVKKDDEKINSDVYMLTGSQKIYVSQNNIYITYTKYISEYELEMEVMREMLYPKLSEKYQDRIVKIESAENYILNDYEKREKIIRILENYLHSLTDEEQEKLSEELERKMKEKYEDISKELEKTVIHKIGINKGELDYKTFGEVTGAVLNQFSMDESGGYFRIATTKSREWSRYIEDEKDYYNNIYVLDDNLKIVGSLEGLAEGEIIYSVRFMQDRAYMVTFEQTDPLFVIDLKNPLKPKVLGKLKIPGFSNYLHPFDSETLIGVGKDTKETEFGGVRTEGLKLSLFDVSDVANPKEIDTYIMGDAGSDSIALYDHKAFLFSRDKNLLSIPVSIRESLSGRSYGNLVFSGAAVFKIDKNGFELWGKIDHSDGGHESEKDYWRGYNYYDNTVKRILYIDDVLYTFSNNYLMMNKLNDDLDLVKKLKLKKEKEDDFEIIN